LPVIDNFNLVPYSFSAESFSKRYTFRDNTYELKFLNRDFIEFAADMENQSEAHKASMIILDPVNWLYLENQGRDSNDSAIFSNEDDSEGVRVTEETEFYSSIVESINAALHCSRKDAFIFTWGTIGMINYVKVAGF
jgi:uncharacterized membrane protein